MLKNPYTHLSQPPLRKPYGFPGEMRRKIDNDNKLVI